MIQEKNLIQTCEKIMKKETWIKQGIAKL